MANQEQLDILIRAIKENDINIWNRWRTDNLNIIPDLSDAILCNINFAGIDFSKTLLCNAVLSSSNFNGANLSSANLLNAILIESDLSEANLLYTNLSGVKLNKANLFKACLIEADLSNSDISFANISGIALCGANLTNVNTAYIKYNRKDMRKCYLGIRGIDSCYGNAVFKRDAQDQDYLDTLEQMSKKNWREKSLFYLWSWTNFGRSIPRVAGFALFLVIIFGIIYSLFPTLIRFGEHPVTNFSPFYFSFVTYTTLGFGDVTAGCLAGEILVCIEVVLGYLTLGMLLAILANTVARRS